MGKIVILMGQSSSGKDTIQKELFLQKKFVLKPLVLHTTRPPREGEQNGREYYFDTEEQMHHLEKNGRIIEKRCYQTIAGLWYYYTTSEGVDLKNYNYLTSNTLEGLDKFSKYYTEEELLSILIQTDDGIRLNRALEREERQPIPNYKEMCRRFLADQKDSSRENIEKRKIDAIIKNNGTLEETLEKVNKVLSLHL